MTVKKKSLFDHVNQVTSVQNPSYWDEISDEDKKSWSNYMVNRFLSMKPDWIDLVNEIQKKSDAEIIVPSKKIIDFKEAIIFAFLGLLKWQNSINCLASVTGAKRDHSSGKVFKPKSKIN